MQTDGMSFFNPTHASCSNFFVVIAEERLFHWNRSDDWEDFCDIWWEEQSFKLTHTREVSSLDILRFLRVQMDDSLL